MYTKFDYLEDQLFIPKSKFSMEERKSISAEYELQSKRLRKHHASSNELRGSQQAKGVSEL